MFPPRVCPEFSEGLGGWGGWIGRTLSNWITHNLMEIECKINPSLGLIDQTRSTDPRWNPHRTLRVCHAHRMAWNQKLNRRAKSLAKNTGGYAHEQPGYIPGTLFNLIEGTKSAQCKYRSGSNQRTKCKEVHNAVDCRSSSSLRHANGTQPL